MPSTAGRLACRRVHSFSRLPPAATPCCCQLVAGPCASATRDACRRACQRQRPGQARARAVRQRVASPRAHVLHRVDPGKPRGTNPKCQGAGTCARESTPHVDCRACMHVHAQCCSVTFDNLTRPRQFNARTCRPVYCQASPAPATTVQMMTATDAHRHVHEPPAASRILTPRGCELERPCTLPFYSAAALLHSESDHLVRSVRIAYARPRQVPCMLPAWHSKKPVFLSVRPRIL